jgi:DNA-binding CsgD family transcriptional regulator
MEIETTRKLLDQIFQFSRHGLLWLDSRLNIVTCNTVAHRLLGENDGVFIRDQRLDFSRRDIKREFERFMHPTRKGRARNPGSSSVRLTRRFLRPSGRGTLLVVGIVLVQEGQDAWNFMVIEDLNSHPPLDYELCRDIYSLTPAETRVAARLLDGRSVPGIAKDMKLSPLTVRTHVKRVFKKTGVHSQAQLMSALCKLAFLPLGEPGWPCHNFPDSMPN